MAFPMLQIPSTGKELRQMFLQILQKLFQIRNIFFLHIPLSLHSTEKVINH